MNPITGLATARILIGLLSVVAPSAASRLFLLDPAANPQLGFLARLFGSREVALGAMTLATSGSTRRTVVAAGVAVDAADAAASLVAGRESVIGRVPAALLTGVALSAVGTGVASLVRRA